ncbi:bifunctional DNA primase/polymerase [Streptomyces sp. NPDC090025]|uniref:bifunctional DNA primase/polymerase n=1 Tax=Streptomyces sp. NPDC090025 TaxID=3365922 RepID=UPI0038388A0B
MTWRDLAWLAEAADAPAACLNAWASDPRAPYPLSTGRVFDVVSVDQRVGIEAFDQLLRKGRPLGPVVLDHRARRTGFLLPPDSRADFTRRLARGAGAVPAVRYLGQGSVLVVPGPRSACDDRYAWFRAPAPQAPAGPLIPVALAAALLAAVEALGCADRLGEPSGHASASAPRGPEGVWARAG